MKTIKLLLILAIFLFTAETAMAAEYYVRAGASGNGADWTNAYGSLPTTLVRGSTYYIADGSYPGYTFDDPNSGTSIITIKKATVANHGSGPNANTGWSNTYGDGQAIFNGAFEFYTDYYAIDGATRNESNWSDGPSYGIKVPRVATNSYWAGHAADNITLKYLDIGADYGSAYSASYAGVTAIYLGGFGDTAANWLVHRCYIHNVEVIGQHAGADNVIYEYNFIGPNWQKTGIRHQGRGSSCIFRYNVFKNACQGIPGQADADSCTAIIGWYGNAGSNNENYSNSKVYGNVFWDTRKQVRYTDACILMGDDRTSQGGGPQNCAGCAAYNNIFAGMYGPTNWGNCDIEFGGTITGSEARNNVWYDIGSHIYTGCSAATCSNNVKFTTGSSGIFVNAANGNFRLTSDGAAGTGQTLGSPYNADMDGTTRGSGAWDIGAFEYSSGSTPSASPGPPGPLQ